MSKSIKLNDDNYIDSGSIVHNKRLLSDMLNDTCTDAGGIPRSKIIHNCDFNILPNWGPGLWVAYGPCTNAPMYSNNSAYHWYVLQLQMGGAYACQITTPLHTNLDYLFMRHRVNAVWRGWYQITTTQVS